MRITSAFNVDHASRRIVSAFTSVAVALTMVRFAFGQNPGRRAYELEFEFVD